MAIVSAKFIAGAILSAALLASAGVQAKPKCSAPGAAEWEGTDQEGITRKCQAIFDACINESAPCDTRKKACAQYDKMDRDGSCFKKKR